MYKIRIDYDDATAEEIEEWGNTLSIILPDPDDAHKAYKVLGYFLNVRKWFIDEYRSDIDDYVEEWLTYHVRDLRRLIYRYTYQRTDAYRGVYVSKSDSVGRWKMVVSGWVAMLSGDNALKALSDYEALRWHGKYVPTIFVFPRSSNVAVAYFDVWTTHPITFKKMLELKPGDYEGEGYFYYVK